MSADHDEAPAFSPGAADLLRTLVERGLAPDAIKPAASLVVCLDMGVRPRASASSSASATATTTASAIETDHGADELARLLDEATEL